MEERLKQGRGIPFLRPSFLPRIATPVGAPLLTAEAQAPWKPGGA